MVKTLGLNGGGVISQAQATSLLNNTVASIQSEYNAQQQAVAAGKVAANSNTAFIQGVANWLYSPIGASELLPGGGALLPGGAPGINPANIVAASQFSATPAQVSTVVKFLQGNFQAMYPNSNSGSSIGGAGTASIGGGSGIGGAGSGPAGFSLGGGGLGGGGGFSSAGGINLITIAEYAAIGGGILLLMYWATHRGKSKK